MCSLVFYCYCIWTCRSQQVQKKMPPKHSLWQFWAFFSFWLNILSMYLLLNFLNLSSFMHFSASWPSSLPSNISMTSLNYINLFSVSPLQIACMQMLLSVNSLVLVITLKLALHLQLCRTNVCCQSKRLINENTHSSL